MSGPARAAVRARVREREWGTTESSCLACAGLWGQQWGERVGEERRMIEGGWREGERESERKGLRVLIVLSPLVTRCLN